MTSPVRFGLQAWLLSPKTILRIGEPLFRLMGRRRATGVPAPNECRRILVLHLDEIGDVVLSTGFMRELRRNAPHARITLVVKPAVFNLVELCPYVDEILTYDARTTSRSYALLVRFGRAVKLALRHLLGRRFDLSINPRRATDYYYANALAYLSGAPQRLGCASWQIGEPSLEVEFITTIVRTNAVHEAAHHFDFLRQIGCKIEDESLELWPSEVDRRSAHAALLAGGIDNKQLYCVLAPGAGAPQRLWPIERFREIAARLVARTELKVVVIGSENDRELSAAICAGQSEHVVDLAGALSLRETAAVLENSRVFIGNDSGPMHIAAAVGVPVVEISSFPRSAPTGHVNSPSRFGPWRVPSVVVQPDSPLAPCTIACNALKAHCITQVDIDHVFESVRSILEQADSRSSLLSS